MYFFVFILFLAALSLRCCAGFLQWQSFSLQWLLLLQSTGCRQEGSVGAHQLQSAGSVVVVHGLNCLTECGIFPDVGSSRPGIIPMSPALASVSSDWWHIEMWQLWDLPGGLMVGNLPANAGTWVWSLVREDSTCLETTEPVCCGRWALEPESCDYSSLQV